MINIKNLTEFARCLVGHKVKMVGNFRPPVVISNTIFMKCITMECLIKNPAIHNNYQYFKTKDLTGMQQLKTEYYLPKGPKK